MENSRESLSSSMSILDALNKEDLSLEEVIPLVRSEAQAQQLIALRKAGQFSGFDTRDPTEITWEYGSSGVTGFQVLKGLRKDFHNFRAYFVKQEEGIRFDLAATQAISEVPIVDLPNETLTGKVRLRCWLSKEPHFDSRSDRDLFSWYQVVAPDEVDFVWAYCQTGSPLDERLRFELNYGKLIGERKEKFRAMIDISEAREFNKDEFIFEELVTTEWVLPAVE